MASARAENLLTGLDYSVLQKCIHCGICLSSCPTYEATLMERSSPRGRIAMMRAIADGRLEVSRGFAEELYFCLGCLACQTACPAGVDYTNLFEHARAEIERAGVLNGPLRSAVRRVALKWLFASRKRLHRLGALLRFYQRSGLQGWVRTSGILRWLPSSFSELESLSPAVQDRFTEAWFREDYAARNPTRARYRVGLLAGCIQDIAFSDVNADTIYVLQQNGCEVILPRGQECCGSLFGHNGELEHARVLARQNIDAFPLDDLDAVITNAGGCGSHMKHYARLLCEDPAYSERAKIWSEKVKDIHEFLVAIDYRAPRGEGTRKTVAYHDSCHLAHGQKITTAPRQVLDAIPGMARVPLPEADWCCGSAGVYNLTQPEMSMQLQERKMRHVKQTGAEVVAAANPGCLVQLVHGAKRFQVAVEVKHPVSLLAEAYREADESR